MNDQIGNWGKIKKEPYGIKNDPRPKLALLLCCIVDIFTKVLQIYHNPFKMCENIYLFVHDYQTPRTWFSLKMSSSSTIGLSSTDLRSLVSAPTNVLPV